ncbi:hypothetical protein ABPG75_010793 [Micractinium tetrahymenae]
MAAAGHHRRSKLHPLPGPEFAPWEEALDQLPKFAVAAGRRELRAWLCSLPPFPTAALLPPHQDASRASSASSSDELWRAYLLLSFLSHGYMWCDDPEPPTTLPALLAAPWCAVAAALDMPPVLTYSTYNLLNWRRLDPAGPVALGNTACLANFLGGVDEEWFRLVHVQIEQLAAPAIAALPAGQRAAAAGEAAGVRAALEAICAALVDMQATLARMGEKCDPHVYYHRVRLPLSGWRGNPALPKGLIYEGQFGGQPQQYYGATGAQSSIVPALDAALGIRHDRCSWLSAYLEDQRAHMPPAHHAFVAALEAGPSLQAAAGAGPPSLKAAYNECVHQLERFRSQHRGFAAAYIVVPGRKANEKGTGGSDFMPALTSYRDATARHMLS